MEGNEEGMKEGKRKRIGRKEEGMEKEGKEGRG